jgi:CRP-like cAMP-binding protein
LESLDVQVLAVLERGDAFGEMGLLEAAPRAATIRSLDEGDLFEVDKGTFDRLLSDTINAPRFAPTMQALAELRELPPFAGLRSVDLADLMEHGAWRTFPPGMDLVREGEESDLFYVIRSGKATVSQDGKPIRTLQPGSYFGEIGLLSSAPRSATVTAATPIRAFTLDREGFERVVADSFTRGILKTATERFGHH